MGDDDKVVQDNMISRGVKEDFYERVVMPTMVYGSETRS